MIYMEATQFFSLSAQCKDYHVQFLKNPSKTYISLLILKLDSNLGNKHMVTPKSCSPFPLNFIMIGNG